MTYRSHADLGGQEGHGAVTPEAEGVLFHASWERMALAVTLAMGATGTWNIDESRSIRETLPDYNSLTYYEIWIKGLIVLLQKHSLVSADEITAGAIASGAIASGAIASGANVTGANASGAVLYPARRPVKRVLRAADVAAALAKGSPTIRTIASAPRFTAGDSVITRGALVDHHTRLPAYARGKRGRITAVYGAHVFADTHAQGLGEQPQWLYNVVFTAQELWGTGAAADSISAADTVSIDAWESYLEPAP